MISQLTIDNVFSAVDAVEIISRHIDLKKSGKNWKGKCPFHQESDASFSVSSEKNMYSCFGCNKSGNAVNFLMDFKSISYPEAIKEVAAHYGIDVIEDHNANVDDEVRQKQELFFDLYEHAKTFFHNNLFKEENAIALEYAFSRFTLDQIQHYQIGYATDQWSDLRDYLKRHTGADDTILAESKLISYSKSRYFDFFRNRLMFPIWNASSRVISFGGRILPDSKGPKYLNTGNTIIYNKSKALYLYNYTSKAIRETSCFYLVEGYTDAIALHSNTLTNTVAPCGTALTDDQIGLLKKNASTAILVYDGDQAGGAAANESTLKLIKEGLIVKVFDLPDGQDPYDFFKSPDNDPASIKEKATDYLFYKARSFVKNSHDPMVVHEAIKFLSKLIVSYTDKSLRNTYVEELCKILKTAKKRFTDEIASLDAAAHAITEQSESLPDGVDVSDYEKYGFYAYNNEYYFRDKGGRVKLSNFVMKPLFHVESINDTKRIFEITNYRGHRIVVDFDMQEMVSITNFKRNIEGRGNFLFEGNDQHMGKLKRKLYDQTRTCTQIDNLGWQKEGFFAWSNGIVNTDGIYTEVDENGLVNFNNKDFFIPAFSKIYIDDKTLYIDERKFKYIPREISLKEWSSQFIKVFGDNAKLGIAFWLATAFRDHLLHIFKNFPLLNLFGPKGTGKSQMAMSLSCLYGQQQTPFNIHNGTKPGLAEHIQLFSNAFAWIDEYKNNIEYDKIETLKSIYDAIGRSRMNIDKGKKKETTQVNSAVIISGQEMPTADVALFSRMIFLQFHQTEYSQAEKDDYKMLKSMERQGLSHLTSQLIQHREYFSENFFPVFEEVLADISIKLEHHAITERILQSFCYLLATFKTLEDKLDLSVTYDELRSFAIQSIVDQDSQINSSNEISQFWETVEALFDDDELIDRWHFKIDLLDQIKEKNRSIPLEPPVNVLQLKFSSIYKAYATHSRKAGQPVLPNTTLRYYLRNSPAYLGEQGSSRFTLKSFDNGEGQITEKHQITNAFCFSYDKLGINLIRIPTEKEDPFTSPKSPDSLNEKDDQPF